MNRHEKPHFSRTFSSGNGKNPVGAAASAVRRRRADEASTPLWFLIAVPKRLVNPERSERAWQRRGPGVEGALRARTLPSPLEEVLPGPTTPRMTRVSDRARDRARPSPADRASDVFVPPFAVFAPAAFASLVQFHAGHVRLADWTRRDARSPRASCARSAPCGGGQRMKVAPRFGAGSNPKSCSKSRRDDRTPGTFSRAGGARFDFPEIHCD